MIAQRLNRNDLLRGVNELCARDADLANIVQRYGPPPMWGRRPGFATLSRIILEQQVSLASADATFARLRRGVGRVTASRVANSSPTKLRRLGLTRQKAGYCLDLARLVTDGDLDLRRLGSADDSTARETLLGIRGIGPWTADIYLLMALRRPNVWPDGDLALENVMRRVTRPRKRPTRDRARRIASHWAPWRSVAARLLWHYYLRSRR